MIYIITALKAEATYFIETYRLEEREDKHFKIYESKTIKLIISGVGKIHAAAATTYLLQKFPSHNQRLFNIGTCTSVKEDIEIGTIHQIRKIIDVATNHSYHINKEGEAISCLDIALSKNQTIKTPLADMESAAVYLAGKHFTKEIKIFKILSDYRDDTIPHSHTIYALFKEQERALKELLDA
jgi:nucleoside phosphorylase